MPASPASVITNGMVAITLLPKFDRTQSATPHAIMNKEWVEFRKEISSEE